MSTLLPESFYLSKDVLHIAKSLIGKVINTNIEGKFTSGMIVETEAYRAPDDKACHAYNNRLTNRTKVMFEKGGIAYIYLCYGIHHLFNVVTADAGLAHAILIRGIEPLDGISTMCDRRRKSKIDYSLTSGPGTASLALGITSKLSGISITKTNSPIYLTDYKTFHKERIFASPRVGIDYAEECAKWPWRFRLKESPWTSKPN
ncbi:MAG: DNA-3-methyladenine glycosylase [Bacteroidia bacterium]|nr:DNA-3-methyladenine glycosylase [Bacteroidia bacterium]